MGWGIASFKDQKDATGFGVAMDFDSMTKAPKWKRLPPLQHC